MPRDFTTTLQMCIIFASASCAKGHLNTQFGAMQGMYFLDVVVLEALLLMLLFAKIKKIKSKNLNKNILSQVGKSGVIPSVPSPSRCNPLICV